MAQTEIKEIPFKHRKKFFTIRVIKRWSRLLRKVVDYPSLKVFKPLMDLFLDSLF